MESEIIKICGVAILAAVAVSVLGAMAPFGGGLITALRIAGAVLALGGVVMLIFSVLESLSALTENVAEEYISVMVRGLGICVLCRVCSDICRDCGQVTLASAVESAGKVGMILLAMPTVIKMINAV